MPFLQKSPSVLLAAMLLAAIPAFAQGGTGADAVRLSDGEFSFAPEDAASGEDSASVRIVDAGDWDAEGADFRGFFLSAMTLPTQSLTSTFNPATAHLDRSHPGATSRLITAGWSDAEAGWWQPAISYVLEQDRSPVASGFGAADTLNRDTRATLVAHNLAAEWNVGNWRVGYRLNSAVERAAESTLMDPTSRSLGRGAYFGWQVTDRLDVQIDFGADRIRDTLNATSALWRSRAISAQWQFDGGFTLGSSLYQSRSVASESMPAMSSRVVDLSLSYAIGGAASSDSGSASQAYVRLERQSLSAEGVAFSADTPQKPWSITVGLNMPF